MPNRFGLSLLSRSRAAGVLSRSSSIIVPPAPPLFSYNFDVDWGIWTGTYRAGPDVTVSNDATAQAVAGTPGALKIDIGDFDDNYLFNLLSPTNTSGVWRARFYLDPNGVSLLAFPPYMMEVLVMQGNGGETFILKFGQISAGQYVAGILSMIDGGGYAQGSGLMSDAPHCIEGEVRRSDGSNNGRARLWIDDILQYDSGPTLDNDAAAIDVGYFPFGAFGGVPYEAPGGSIYLDELIINDDGSHIGMI